MKKKLTAIIAILVIILAGYGCWYYFKKAPKHKKNHGVAEYDTLIQPDHYKKIPVHDFSYVVIKCDLGPVKVYIKPDTTTSLEFHRSFMKYTDISYQGDTLIIHTYKTPESTKENPIYRQIYINTSDMKYYQAEATQTFFSDMKLPQLKVDNRSSYIRFHECEIGQLDLATNKSCNYVLDDNCFINKVRANINTNSSMTMLAYVETEIALKNKQLYNITLSDENIRKLKLIK